MISIWISREAYEAIKATLPEAAASWPVQRDDRGLIRIWLDRQFVDRLARCAAPARATAT
jgi:hypothetical protein